MANPGRPIHAGPKTFDEAKLSTMIEPLKVRIDRLKNNQRSPIPVPDLVGGGDGSAGDSYTKDDIRNLETYLVTYWSGGGLYEITVTDSSENPLTMRWYPFWAPAEFPERVPPPLEGARSPDAPVIPIAPSINSGARMAFIPPPQSAPVQQFQAGGYPLPAPPPVGTHQYNAWREEAERREERGELRRLREENERREREAREEKHRAELERERTANNARFANLENTLLQMMNTIKEASTTPKGPTQAELDMRRQMDELREENRRAREAAETARREQEADRRESQLREQMRTQAEEARRAYEATQAQIVSMQREFQTSIANLMTQLTQAGNKSDPMMQLMLESTRQHSEMVKEISRENRAAMERVQAMIMNPRDLMALARESQDGVEKAVARTTALTSSVLEMQNRVLQTAIDVQPQGNGVIDAVTQGMNNVKEFLERFVQSKGREAVAQAQAQAQIAQAQAHAVEVHARASNPSAFAPPPPPGLAGAPMEHVAQPTSQSAETPIEPPAQPAQPVKPARVERLWGRTDEEWFGVVLPEVQGLRSGVAEFQAAVDVYTRTGNAPTKIEDIPGTHPAEAARGIVMAVSITQQQGLVVPAIVELLMPGAVVEFLSVLLPDATQKYRDEVIAELQRGAAGGAKPEDEDEDEDEDENESDEHENVEAPRPAQPARRGRRHPSNGRAS